MSGEPFFRTERLTVYRTEASEGFDSPRWVFNAVAHHDPHCGVAVTAVIGASEHVTRATLWWLETSTMMRRCGYATELVRALTKRYPKLLIMPGSDDGDDFVHHWKRLCDSGAVEQTGTIYLR